MAITDEAVWHSERRLWLEGGSAYPELVEPEAVLALPGVGLMSGAQATAAMAESAGWRSIMMGDKTLTRCGRLAIAIGYLGKGVRNNGSAYEAWCTSTYHVVGDGWRLIQHQQTPTSY